MHKQDSQDQWFPEITVAWIQSLREIGNLVIFTVRGNAKRGICRRRVSVCVSVCLSHSGIVSQVALLWQRNRATHLSVEILQLQNIPFEN